MNGWICICVLLVRAVIASKVRQLGFGLMVYQKPNHDANYTIHSFNRMMKGIYDANNHVYVIHLDIKSDANVTTYITNYCTSRHNCHMIPARNVAWASLSTAEMMLALLQRALVAEWQYFIFLGHESVGLTSLSHLSRVIFSYPANTNFMNCWRLDGYDFFGQWENNMYRLEEIVVDDFNGTLLSTPLRRHAPTDITFYKSLQQVILSRDAVDYVLFGEHTRRVMVYLANVRTADEMLIPTLVMMNASLSARATCNTTLHYQHWIRPGGSWHPEYLTLEHLPLLLQTQSILARKVDTNQSELLLVALDRLKQSVEETNSVEDLWPYYSDDILHSSSDWLSELAKRHVATMDTNNNYLQPAQQWATEQLDMNTTTANILHVLDTVRRARDALEIKKFKYMLEQRRLYRDIQMQSNPNREEL